MLKCGWLQVFCKWWNNLLCFHWVCYGTTTKDMLPLLSIRLLSFNILCAADAACFVFPVHHSYCRYLTAWALLPILSSSSLLMLGIAIFCGEVKQKGNSKVDTFILHGSLTCTVMKNLCRLVHPIFSTANVAKLSSLSILKSCLLNFVFLCLPLHCEFL